MLKTPPYSNIRSAHPFTTLVASACLATAMTSYTLGNPNISFVLGNPIVSCVLGNPKCLLHAWQFQKHVFSNDARSVRPMRSEFRITLQNLQAGCSVLLGSQQMQDVRILSIRYVENSYELC